MQAEMLSLQQTNLDQVEEIANYQTELRKWKELQADKTLAAGPPDGALAFRYEAASNAAKQEIQDLKEELVTDRDILINASKALTASSVEVLLSQEEEITQGVPVSVV